MLECLGRGYIRVEPLTGNDTNSGMYIRHKVCGVYLSNIVRPAGVSCTLYCSITRLDSEAGDAL